MSDTSTKQAKDELPKRAGEGSEQYEPPRLTHVGNARDLLAGAAGTQPDVPPSPIRPQRGG